MKITSLTLALLSTVGCLFSQSCIEDFNLSVNDILATNDGHFILSSGNFTCTKVDANFDTVWHNNSLEFSNLSLRKLRQTFDGNLIGCGNYNGPCIFKMNPFGDTLWTKKVEIFPPGPGFINLSDIIQTADSGYALTGSYGMMSLFAMVLKTDQAGDTLWTRKNILGPVSAAAYTHKIKSIAEFSNGDLLIGGQIDENDFISPPKRYSYGHRLSSAGDSIWIQSYDNHQFHSLAIDGDDDVIIASSLSEPGNQAVSTGLKLSSNGDSVWTKGFAGLSFQTVISVPNGGYLFGGNSATSLTSAPFLVRTDQTGETIWSAVYPHDSLDKEIGLLAIGGHGGFHLFGSTTTFSSPFSPEFIDFTIKTDSSGNCSPAAVSIEPHRREFLFSASPNPTNGILRIDWTEERESVDIVLYDVHGHQLLHSTEPTIDLTPYPSGIYLLKATHQRTSGLVKVLKY